MAIQVYTDTVDTETADASSNEASTFAINPDLAGDDGAVEVLPRGVYPVGTDLPSGWTELFRVNGRIYAVPKEVNPQVAFRFIRALKQRRSEELAMADMMYEVLGDAVIDALADEDLAPDQLKQVMGAVQKYALSTMQRAGLGN